MILRNEAGKRANSGSRPSALRRGVNRRTWKKKILIVCEGETEEYYFDALKREDSVRERFSVTLRCAGGGSATEVILFAIEQQRLNEDEGPEMRYDSVWCVVDAVSTHDAGALRNAIDQASRKGIQICFSNPCFEVWFLAHYENTARKFATCLDVQRKVRTHFGKGINNRRSAIRPQDVFPLLKSRTETAIGNARDVRERQHKSEIDILKCNSSTEVYRLVVFLTKNA